MAWHQTGDKPFPEPMPTHLTDEFMRHLGRAGVGGLMTSYEQISWSVKGKKQEHALLEALLLSIKFYTKCVGNAYKADPFTPIPVWITNYIHYKMCDEITHPFPWPFRPDMDK